MDKYYIKHKDIINYFTSKNCPTHYWRDKSPYLNTILSYIKRTNIAGDEFTILQRYMPGFNGEIISNPRAHYLFKIPEIQTQYVFNHYPVINLLESKGDDSLVGALSHQLQKHNMFIVKNTINNYYLFRVLENQAGELIKILFKNNLNLDKKYISNNLDIQHTSINRVIDNFNKSIIKCPEIAEKLEMKLNNTINGNSSLSKGTLIIDEITNKNNINQKLPFFNAWDITNDINCMNTFKNTINSEVPLVVNNNNKFYEIKLGNDRNGEIIKSRLFDEKTSTLQELGDLYQVTRERVRQIERKCLILLKSIGINIDEIKNNLKQENTLNYNSTLTKIISNLAYKINSLDIDEIKKYLTDDETIIDNLVMNKRTLINDILAKIKQMFKSYVCNITDLHSDEKFIVVLLIDKYESIENIYTFNCPLGRPDDETYIALIDRYIKIHGKLPTMEQSHKRSHKSYLAIKLQRWKKQHASLNTVLNSKLNEWGVEMKSRDILRKENFDKKISQLKTFVYHNRRWPSNSSKDTKEKKLANFILGKEQNYKQGSVLHKEEYTSVISLLNKHILSIK